MTSSIHVALPTSPFVSTKWLLEHLQDSNLVILDGSWYLPAMKRNPEEEYKDAHISGALRFDIECIKDHASALPHMLPTAHDFAQAVGGMGIQKDSVIVIYDGLGLFSAPRVWWTFRVFGAQHVFVLEGGFPKWQKEGYPVETGESQARQPKTFQVQYKPEMVANCQQIKAVSESASHIIVDARGEARFNGTAPDIRPGVRSGHIPGSVNLPFDQLVTNGILKPETDIINAFQQRGVDLNTPFIVSCGSGVTASVLALAAYHVSGKIPTLYDGSWSEWGACMELSAETE